MEWLVKNWFVKLLVCLLLLVFTIESSRAATESTFPPAADQPPAVDTQELIKTEDHWKLDQKDTAQTNTENAVSASSAQNASTEQKEFFTRQQKVALLNVGSWAVIMAYGMAEWDYNQTGLHFKNEGWFGKDTSYGGSDKLGHAWSAYALSHLFSYLYRHWQYTDKEAHLYGALSSLGVNTFMEIADGFSPSQGFSYEDMMMNLLGSGMGYLLGAYPELGRKIDFRLEITPKFDHQDLKVGTNYDRHVYLVAIKADGFDFIENPYLKYLELHLGYGASDYAHYKEGQHDNRNRHIYAGIGFNVSKLLQKYVKTTVLDYIQIPYTSLRHDFQLD